MKIRGTLGWLGTPPPTCPSNAWNPRKWTNRQTHARNKSSFRSIQDDGTVSHLTSYPTFLESTRKNKSNFNMFLSFTPFTHLHEIIWWRNKNPKNFSKKPTTNNGFFLPNLPGHWFSPERFRTSAASLFKASPNLSASFWEVGSQDTWTQVGWLQLSWRWRWLLHLRVVPPCFSVFCGKDCE